MIAGGHDTHSGAVYRATSSARTTTATPATATPATATSATTVATAATATSAPAMTTTAAQIRAAMEALDLDQVAAHFAARADDNMDDDDGMDDDDNNDNDDDLDDDDVRPLVVCDGVSVRAFNEYVGDGEGLRIGVRFLQLEADGRLLIVEFPTKIHEATAEHFRRALYRGIGNLDHIDGSGSVTVHRAGHPSKEADATFGPFDDTPNRAPLPANVTDWITLAVEIGRSQSWASLLEAARWWHGYPGIQYVLLLKISRQAEQLRYALFNVALHPLQQGQGVPAPVAEGSINHRTVGDQTPETIEFDARQIFAIAPNLALPPNVSDPISVDLREVMNWAWRSFGRRRRRR